MSNSAGARVPDFSYLDQEDFRAKYASGQSLERIRFYIGGIRCGKCVRKLEDLPLRLTGLRQLRVEMGRNLAHIEIDPKSARFSDVADEICRLGFEPVPVSHDEDFHEQERREERSEIIRLAVAGMLAGNIMTFAFATYLGAPPEWSQIFAWLSFALYLPVLTYVAYPFYRGSLNSLRQRQISIDLPMAIASLVGFIFSTVELVRGRSDIYFDSLSGFLFLILISRFVQKRLQKYFLRPSDLGARDQLRRARKIDSRGWSWIPRESLQKGDRFLLQASETLPLEAELQSAKAYFSLAWLSGESKPRTFLRGAIVPAGARLLSGEAQMLFQKPLEETAFGRILQEVQRFSLSKNSIVNRADRWAQILLGTVFAMAVVFLFAYWPVSPEGAIQRALALLILACPCAMAFGTPLALASALKKARQAGLIVRDANVLERVTDLQTIFFDKTGTLTEVELTLQTPLESISTVYRKIILSLENESLHPIAFAFRAALGQPGHLPPTDARKEIEGVGVSGFIYGRSYELKRSPQRQSGVSCALFEDEKMILEFQFRSNLKEDGVETLEALRARGLKLRLLSGDQEAAAQEMGLQLGFLPEEIQGALSPEDKAEVVAKTPNAMMVGDGVNDSLALLRADVAVAVSGGVEAALRSSHIYMTESNLQALATLFDVADFSRRSIRQNLLISAVYNTAGGALALLGFVNPFVAALLMPLSSGFILLSTWIRSWS